MVVYPNVSPVATTNLAPQKYECTFFRFQLYQPHNPIIVFCFDFKLIKASTFVRWGFTPKYRLIAFLFHCYEQYCQSIVYGEFNDTYRLFLSLFFASKYNLLHLFINIYYPFKRLSSRV